MLTTYTRGKSFCIAIGDVEVVTLTVNDRYQANGSRRPRNLAIYVATHDTNPKIGRSLGEHMYVSEAINLLVKMQIPFEDFTKLCFDNEWGSEVPGTQTLF